MKTFKETHSNGVISMLTVQRHEMILNLLKEKKVIKIIELVEATNSSESTIRRDLTELEQAKKLKRIHGGAALLQGKLEEPTVVEKAAKNNQEKMRIAHYAASLVQNGDSIFLDAGTTTRGMIKELKGKDIVVVTNGFDHIRDLLEAGIRTYVTGGYVKAGTYAFIGQGAIQSIESYRFDKAFIGTNGVHPLFGLTTPDPEEAYVKKTAIGNAHETFVLADHSKFGEVSFAKFVDLKDIIIVTSDMLETKQLGEIQKLTTIEVVRA